MCFLTELLSSGVTSLNHQRSTDVFVCEERFGPSTLLHLVPSERPLPLLLLFFSSLMQLIILPFKTARRPRGSVPSSLRLCLSFISPLSCKLEATSVPISWQASEQRGRNYPLQNWSKQSQSGTARKSRRMKLGESVTFFNSLYHQKRVGGFLLTGNGNIWTRDVIEMCATRGLICFNILVSFCMSRILCTQTLFINRDAPIHFFHFRYRYLSLAMGQHRSNGEQQLKHRRECTELQIPLMTLHRYGSLKYQRSRGEVEQFVGGSLHKYESHCQTIA